MEKDHVTALNRAIAVAGGSQAKLAKRLTASGTRPVSQQLVSYWVKSKSLIGPEWWSAFEVATDMSVTRRDLRPDVFPRNHAA